MQKVASWIGGFFDKLITLSDMLLTLTLIVVAFSIINLGFGLALIGVVLGIIALIIGNASLGALSGVLLVVGVVLYLRIQYQSVTGNF